MRKRALAFFIHLLLALCISGCGSSSRGSAAGGASRGALPRFVDVTERAGIRFVHHNGALGRKWMPETTGSGGAFLDADGDGWQDAFIANGHIDDLVYRFDTQITYAERPLLFRNDGGKRFIEIGEQLGEPLRQQYVLRGCACGDIDRDGDLDLLVVPNNNQPARLWRNDGGNRSHWIRFRLAGTRSNRSGLGARVTVRAGGMTQRRWVKSGGSYLSQSELPATFGLGEATRVEEVEVLWPGGRVDTWRDLPADREHALVEGRT